MNETCVYITYVNTQVNLCSSIDFVPSYYFVRTVIEAHSSYVTKEQPTCIEEAAGNIRDRVGRDVF